MAVYEPNAHYFFHRKNVKEPQVTASFLCMFPNELFLLWLTKSMQLAASTSSQKFFKLAVVEKCQHICHPCSTDRPTNRCLEAVGIVETRSNFETSHPKMTTFWGVDTHMHSKVVCVCYQQLELFGKNRFWQRTSLNGLHSVM